VKEGLLDTNIFFNIWRKEIDPNTKKELWRGSKELIDKISQGRVRAFLCIVSLMEIAVVIRKAGEELKKPEREIEEELSDRLDEINRIPNLGILLPTSIDLAIAWSYLYEKKLTPFDSIILSSASALQIPIITRDNKLKEKARGVVEFYEPEEFLSDTGK